MNWQPTDAWPAVMLREWRVASRRRSFRVLRVVAPALAGLALVGAYGLVRAMRLVSAHYPLGLGLFLAVAMVGVWLGVVVCPFATRHQLREAVRSRTLPALAMTDVGLGRALAEQFFGQLGLQLVLQLTCLPIYMGCISLGGLTPQIVVQGLLLVVLSTLLGTSVGFFAGIRFRSEWAMLPLVGVIAAANAFAMMSHRHANWCGSWSCSYGVMGMVFDKLRDGQLLVVTGCHLGLSAVLIGLGIRSARRLLTAPEAVRVRRPGRSLRWAARVLPALGFTDVWQKLSNRELGAGDPIVWREYHRHGGDLRYGLRFALPVVTGLAMMLWLWGGLDLDRDGLALIGLGIGVWMCWRLGSAPQANEGEGTLAQLALTDLEPATILGSKVRARLRPLLPWMATYGALVILACSPYRSYSYVHNGAEIFGPLLTVVALGSLGAYAFGLICCRTGLLDDPRSIRLLFWSILGLDLAAVGPLLMEVYGWQLNSLVLAAAGGVGLAAGIRWYLLCQKHATKAADVLGGMAPSIGCLGILGVTAVIVVVSLEGAMRYSTDFRHGTDMLSLLTPLGFALALAPFAALKSLVSGRDFSLLAAVGGSLLMALVIYLGKIYFGRGSPFPAMLLLALLVTAQVGWLRLYRRWPGLVVERG